MERARTEEIMRTFGRRDVASMFAAAAIAACTSSARPSRLRVTNAASVPVRKLTVCFPEDTVEFGDVAAGATSEYRSVPHGVFAYAAYRAEIGGKPVAQDVVDWVGEDPLAGNSFTYTIDAGADADRPLRLVDVKRDE
jgi:hypothetical protein